MPTKKKGNKERMYSFDEYRRAFCSRVDTESDKPNEDPKVFGVKLAEDALKRINKKLNKNERTSLL